MKLRHVKIGVAFESRVYNDKLRAKDSFSLFFFFLARKKNVHHLQFREGTVLSAIQDKEPCSCSALCCTMECSGILLCG